MNIVYTRSQLESFNRTQLWKICRERGLKCYPSSADCVEAICALAESVEKVAEASVKVDDARQTEEITVVEITFCDHKIYAGKQQIASINYDPKDFETQSWVVIVGKTEIHRADSWAKCHSYICWHYKQGTLPTLIEPVAKQQKRSFSLNIPSKQRAKDSLKKFQPMHNIKTLATTMVICAATITFLPRPASANPLLIPLAIEGAEGLAGVAVGAYGVWQRSQSHKEHHNTVYSSTSSTANGTVEDAGQVSSQDECNKIATARGGGQWRALPVKGLTPVNDAVTGKRINPIFNCKIMKFRN